MIFNLEDLLTILLVADELSAIPIDSTNAAIQPQLATPNVCLC